jgi:hypothetical protein
LSTIAGWLLPATPNDILAAQAIRPWTGGDDHPRTPLPVRSSPGSWREREAAAFSSLLVELGRAASLFPARLGSGGGYEGAHRLGLGVLAPERDDEPRLQGGTQLQKLQAGSVLEETLRAADSGLPLRIDDLGYDATAGQWRYVATMFLPPGG